MCSMVMCKYSKCLPHCSKYIDESNKPPDNCMSWSDGCNTCDLTKIEKPLPNGEKGNIVSYLLDNYSICSKTYCGNI